MPRYFIEVAYKGTHYSGFQTQENADTIQGAVENAFAILHRKPVLLTGSSRTDAGVHAYQNYFHFDFDDAVHEQFVYKMNAILPRDIAIKNIHSMPDTAHCRFDAVSRRYEYRIHRFKDPFLGGSSLYYPYRLDLAAMQTAADLLLDESNFFAFSKTNTQVKNFQCRIYISTWREEGENIIYTIEGNRFLRGMVRLLVGSLLKVGRGKLSEESFRNLFQTEVKAGYSVASDGLYLMGVNYPENYFPASAGAFTSI